MQRGASFLLQIWKFQGFLIPADCNFWHAFVKEALRQPGVSLHEIRESVAAIDILADLLQLADRLVEQSHLAESNSQVVMRLWIFVSAGRIVFKLLLQFAKHAGEVDAGSGIEALRRRRGVSCSGNVRARRRDLRWCSVDRRWG